ncbi:MAG: esterase [Burkholderiales bacterium]|nr:esterase [Burkholderiales bacterium]
MLIYIHGFNSSAQSFKAGLLRSRMAALGLGNEYACPELAHRPRQAVAQLEALIMASPRAATALVGSSLGGFYATWLAEKYGLKAVLVNPAVRPYELLRDCIGPQKNLYTGAEYEFTAQHLDELRELETAAITPERYLLMVQTGDEVLDYRQAVGKYLGAKQIVIGGGDHGFSNFAGYLDTVLEFCGIGH